MACPLFIPSSPAGELVSAAMPLGDLYDGTCAADPLFAIPADTLRRYCNFGYARGYCGLASQSDADATRFLVTAGRAGMVEIAWAVERNHHPVAVGTMEIDTSFAAALADPLKCQARACAAAYARRSDAGQPYAGRNDAAAHP